MRVLLDECVPRKIRRELSDHDVVTVTQRGWSGIENGALLALAQAAFEVFLTVDQNLNYQQNLTAINIGLIVLVARNNRFKTLLPLMPDVRSKLKSIKPGDVLWIGGS